MSEYEKSIDIMDKVIASIKHKVDAPKSEYAFFSEYVKKNRKGILKYVALQPSVEQYDCAYNMLRTLYNESKLSNLNKVDLERIVSKVLHVHTLFGIAVRFFLMMVFLLSPLIYYLLPVDCEGIIFLSLFIGILGSMAITVIAILIIVMCNFRFRLFVIKG